jgi:hypothetical protein
MESERFMRHYGPQISEPLSPRSCVELRAVTLASDTAMCAELDCGVAAADFTERAFHYRIEMEYVVASYS